MIGRLYINEIGPDAAALDFSLWPSQVLDPEHHYGFTYLKTLEHLGIRHEIAPSRRTLFMEAEIPEVKQHIPELNRHIGLIARYGAKLYESPYPSRWLRDNIGRKLGRLTQKTLVELPDDAGIARLASDITVPFADAANNDNEAFDFHIGYRPWWFEADAQTGREGEWQKRGELIQAFVGGQS